MTTCTEVLYNLTYCATLLVAAFLGSDDRCSVLADAGPSAGGTTLEPGRCVQAQSSYYRENTSMALVNQPAGKLTIHYRDASRSKGSTDFHFPYGTLASVVFTAADLLSAALNAVTGCAIDGYSVSYTKFEDTPETPDVYSRVEDKGKFLYRTSNARTSIFSIPGILNSLLLPNGAIDQSNALVIALNDAIVAGDLVFCSADGSDLTALLDAYQIFTGTTKQQRP